MRPKTITTLLSLVALVAACSNAPESRAPEADINSDEGIVGGQTVDLKSTRFASAVLHLVAVDKVDVDGISSVRKSNCTGTLIAKNLVLTAGHCINGLRGRRLYPMLINPKTGKAQSKGLPVMVAGRKIDHDSMSVTEIAVPPGFRVKQGLTSPDIALLKLNRPINSASRAMRLKIDTMGLVKTGQRLLTMGFGLTTLEPENPSHDFRPPNRLQKKQLTVIPASKVKWQKSHKLPDLFFLATERGQTKGTLCQGDSGGPVVRKYREQVFLVGVNARSDRNCEGVSAATSIAAHSRWIQRQAAKWHIKLY
jgi:V8-like Glu-specific endopeptidase